VGKTSPNMEEKQNIITWIFSEHHRLSHDFISDDTLPQSYCLYWILRLVWGDRRNDDTRFSFAPHYLLGFSLVCDESSLHVQKI